MDRTVGKHEALILATLLATIAAMAGAVVYPDRMMVPGFGMFATFVAVLFTPDSMKGW